MKKLYVILVLLITWGMESHSQRLSRGCPKIIFSSSQVMDSACDPRIKRIRPGSSNKVMVRYFNKEKQMIPEDSIWGIQKRNAFPLRLFNGYYYSLVSLSPVYRYSRRIGKHTEYYFSTQLDAPLYPYTQSQLRKYTDSSTYAELVLQSRTDRHELSFDFFTINTELMNNNLWGGGISIKYYPRKKWGTGLIISGAGKRTRDTFGFSITKPLLNYYAIGWLNSFDMVQKSRWRSALNLTNGIAITELRDKAQQEKKHTRYGDSYVPKRILTNYYYLLEPGIDVFVKLFSNNNNPDFYLTGGAKYRIQFGNSRFGTQEVSSSPLFSIGLSLIGFDKEELR